MKLLTDGRNENLIFFVLGNEEISVMERGRLADLTTFIAVADSLSFRAAASQLGVTASALSHSMRQLEERIGMRLLNRTTRSVSVTDAGLRLLERLRPAVDQITGALDDLSQETGRPVGRLRIYVTNMAAMAVIAPIWKRFLSTYPEVNLEVVVGEPSIDIVAKGFDAGIGPQSRSATDMIAVRVTRPIKIAVVGASSYFVQRKPPRAPNDLGRHSCIQYRRDDGIVVDWVFERNGESRTISVDGRVMVNTPELALRAALDGLGIAYAVEAQADPFVRSGQLVRVLEDWSPTIQGLFLYHSSHRRVPAALRAFIDMTQAARSTTSSTRSIKDPFTTASTETSRSG
jgi:DNA-binding transcriptional LysR family regulator